MPDPIAAQPQAGEEQQPQAGNAESQADEAQQETQPETVSLDEAKKLRSEASVLRRRAKDAEAELEKVKAQSMSEQDREIAKAKAEGRAEAFREANLRLVRSEIKATAAGRFSDPSSVADLLDAGRFLDDDGEIDQTAIAEAVDRLAEGRQPFTGSFDGGVRPSPATKSPNEVMNTLLRAPRR